MSQQKFYIRMLSATIHIIIIHVAMAISYIVLNDPVNNTIQERYNAMTISPCTRYALVLHYSCHNFSPLYKLQFWQNPAR